MNILKYFISSAVVLSLFLFSSPTFAATTATSAKSTVVKGQLVAIANVNIQDAKIVSQKDNVFSLVFYLNNGKGLQTGVKYGVQLISQTAKSQTVVDEKIYDESLTLPENSSTKKEIVYTAPDTISGSYMLVITSRNTNGFPFGVTFVDNIKLTATTSGLSILPESCTISTASSSLAKSFPLSHILDIDNNQSLYLSCTAVNARKTPLSVVPYFQTTYRTSYGDPVKATGGDTTPIVFNPLEKKTFTVKLPKAESPQLYNISVVLGANDLVSNTISTRYSVRGANATIENLSLDKDYYVKDDVAELALVWSAFALPDDKLATTIKVNDDRNHTCADSTTKTLPLRGGNPELKVPVVMNAPCFNPHVLVSITDNNGTVLAQKSFNVETKSVSRPANSTPIVIIIVIVLGILLATIVRRFIPKKQNKSKTDDYIDGATPMSLKILLPFLIITCGLFVSHTASANTFTVLGANSSAWFVANINSTVYPPSGTIHITGSVDSFSNINSASMTASTPGSGPVQVIPTVTGPYTGSATLTAPSTLGAFNVTYVGTIDEINYTPTIADYSVNPSSGIAGVCEITFDGSRTNGAVQDSITRGVTVVATYDIQMDNSCIRRGTATFAPGASTAPVDTYTDGAGVSDFRCGGQTNYCSALVTQGGYPITVSIQ